MIGHIEMVEETKEEGVFNIRFSTLYKDGDERIFDLVDKKIEVKVI